MVIIIVYIVGFLLAYSAGGTNGGVDNVDERERMRKPKCSNCKQEIKKGWLTFGGPDSDFDDEGAYGPQIEVCGCGIRFNTLPNYPIKKKG